MCAAVVNSRSVTDVLYCLSLCVFVWFQLVSDSDSVPPISALQHEAPLLQPAMTYTGRDGDDNAATAADALAETTAESIQPEVSLEIGVEMPTLECRDTEAASIPVECRSSIQPEMSSEIGVEMPTLERRDTEAASNVAVESRSPSPPTLCHKDVVDIATQMEGEFDDESSPLAAEFGGAEASDGEMAADDNGGKLAPGHDVFLGTSLGGSSAGGSGRSSTMGALCSQQAGQRWTDAEGAASENAGVEFSEASDEDMLHDAFSESELSIHSRSSTMLSDVVDADSDDDNTTMIGRLLDAAAAAGTSHAPANLQNGGEPRSPTSETGRRMRDATGRMMIGQLLDAGVAGTGHIAGDVVNGGKPRSLTSETGRMRDATGRMIDNVQNGKSESPPICDDSAAVIRRLVDGTEHTADASVQNAELQSPMATDITLPQPLDDLADDHVDVSAQGREVRVSCEDGVDGVDGVDGGGVGDGGVVHTVPHDAACRLISPGGGVDVGAAESAGSDGSVVASLRHDGSNDSAAGECREVDQSDQSSTSAAAATATVLQKLLGESSGIASPPRRCDVADVDLQLDPGAVPTSELNSPAALSSSNSLEETAGNHVARQVLQHSADSQQVVSHSSSSLSHAAVVSPACASNTPHLNQFTQNVGSGSAGAGGGYHRRLSSGSSPLVQQQHLVQSPREMTASDHHQQQRMPSPAAVVYALDYASARPASYSARPLHDASYQSQSVKSSPGVGSAGTRCGMMSPGGAGYSFNSSAHSPATRSPASAAGAAGAGAMSTHHAASYAQLNASPASGAGVGPSVNSRESPTTGFSPAPAISPAAVLTSTASSLTLSSAQSLHQSNMAAFSASSLPLSNMAAAFSCSPADGGLLPFHFPMNVAVPVSATTYANTPSPTPHSLQLLSPSNSNSCAAAARYQTLGSAVRRHQVVVPPARHQLGLAYYGMLPSPPPAASAAYAGVITRTFIDDAPLDQLLTVGGAGAGAGAGGGAGVPSGRQTAPPSRCSDDCSISQLQQLTNRLTDGTLTTHRHAGASPGLSLDGTETTLRHAGLNVQWDAAAVALGHAASRRGASADTGLGASAGARMSDACKHQPGPAARRPRSDKTASSAARLPSHHAAAYSILQPHHHQQLRLPRATDYQQYFTNTAGFFGGHGSPPPHLPVPPPHLPVQMMSFVPASARPSAAPFPPQPASQTHAAANPPAPAAAYPAYSYGRVASHAFNDLPRQ